MQVAIKGVARFYEGVFKDAETGDKKPYYQLGVIDVTESGLQLVKVKVSEKKVSEAQKLNLKDCVVIAEMREIKGKNEFRFESGRVEVEK